MAVLYALLLTAALVCFGIASFAGPRVNRVNLIALGLAFWVLVHVIQQWQAV